MDILDYLYRLFIEQDLDAIKELFHRIVGEDNDGM